jgi:hypothetical protein
MPRHEPCKRTPQVTEKSAATGAGCEKIPDCGENPALVCGISRRKSQLDRAAPDTAEKLPFGMKIARSRNHEFR